MTVILLIAVSIYPGWESQPLDELPDPAGKSNSVISPTELQEPYEIHLQQDSILLHDRLSSPGLQPGEEPR
jgi:hypothetical protein